MRIHFIGICGVAMSAIAIALKEKGHTVTGSDAGFYPPISDHLKKSGINFYPGWHPEKMCANGDPDLVVVGNVAGSTNPEWLTVQEKKLAYKSYPEVLAAYFINENSIVAAGTYGKTTTSAMLTHVFREAKMDPSWMYGGLTIDESPAAHIGKSKWSILEGDEYKTARWDDRAKFMLYSPTHLIITAIQWDHADLYPTEKKYFEAFNRLVSGIPDDGLVVYSIDKNEVVKTVKKYSAARTVSYGMHNDADYRYFGLEATRDGLTFTIAHTGQEFEIRSKMLGGYNAENMTAVFAMATECGVPTKKIIEALATFPGMKRRLEKRYSGAVDVIDDIAHSPAKAESTLLNLHQTYTGKIIAVFEPNTGNRQKQSAPLYKNAFSAANHVIIPKLTKLKTTKGSKQPMEAINLASVIQKTHNNVHCIEDDNELTDWLVENTNEGDVIAFLGSHSFRGMIEETVKKMERKFKK
ncbi:MAG TPA: Mur ligase family protein [Candidatus Magasanikbacteria bacterium]|nr:Mur ligase family protein [Candidatus Magasanikbacteria bacterium]